MLLLAMSYIFWGGPLTGLLKEAFERRNLQTTYQGRGKGHLNLVSTTCHLYLESDHFRFLSPHKSPSEIINQSICFYIPRQEQISLIPSVNCCPEHKWLAHPDPGEVHIVAVFTYSSGCFSLFRPQSVFSTAAPAIRAASFWGQRGKRELSGEQSRGSSKS